MLIDVYLKETEGYIPKCRCRKKNIYNEWPFVILFVSSRHLHADTQILLYGVGWTGGDDMMEKAFTWRFGFDASESRKFLTFVKNKATVNASWVVFRTPLLYWS